MKKTKTRNTNINIIKNIKKIAKKFRWRNYYFLLISLVSLIVFILFFYITFYEKNYPNTYIAGVNVSKLDKKETENLLSQKFRAPDYLILSYQDKKYQLNLDEIGFSYNFKSTEDEAYSAFRDENPLINILHPLYSLLLSSRKDIPLAFNINIGAFMQIIEDIEENTTEKPVYPSVTYKNQQIIIERGKPGKSIDKEKVFETLKENLSKGDFRTIPINTIIDDPTLTQEEEKILRDRVIKLLDKKLVLKIEDEEFEYTQNDILKLLGVKGGYDNKAIEKLSEDVAELVDRKPQNPVFNMENGKVHEFKPLTFGVKTDRKNLEIKITEALNKLETEDRKSINIDIPHSKTPPEYETKDINNLGIKELLGRGKSSFRHSISSRIHNIILASSKFNGVLIKPGETFSFNQTLGDVSSKTGYQQAYIIKDGATILGDGGGVCQVSTTLFRAILNAGLPIIERQPHAYRVGYYEQDSPPGLDATVYSPHPDLRFKNDTPGHLLIQTKADAKNKTLVFEIYGTSDGRIAKTTKPIITGTTPPPEDLYIDDPTMPAGQIKQIDWKAWGAKVRFTYTVTRDGNIIYEKVFYSNYRPWQAKFLRGTGPAQ